MKVISRLGTTNPRLKSAVAIGIFDGVHRGHQFLIKKMVTEARRLKVQAVVVTFFPHPAHVLRPDISLPYLMSLEQRLKLFKKLGVEVVVVIHFNKSFANINPRSFIEKTLVKQLGAQSIFVGEDFRFGKDRSGDIALFQDLAPTLGYLMHAVKPLTQTGEPISSSRLRRLIPEGQLKQAEALLGRPVSAFGKVESGAGRGKLLGFPTANINYESKVLPPPGVYAVRVILGQKNFYGMANLGIRPSFKEKNPKLHLEVNIFNFKRNIYGQEIQVEFLRKIRDEQKFPSKEALIRQIQKDRINIHRLLKMK